MNDTKLVKPFSATVRITDAEKAVKAVRDFYEAVIKQDETTAYQIFQEAGIVQEGLTADEVKKLKETLEHEHVKFLRIVEVGKPVPHSENGTTEVPLKIELEATAGKQTREFSPYVRPVYGHPDRWGICGGI
jgi:ATP-dependent DNA ligase